MDPYRLESQQTQSYNDTQTLKTLVKLFKWWTCLQCASKEHTDKWQLLKVSHFLVAEGTYKIPLSTQEVPVTLILKGGNISNS